jgi:hypothetical protein
MTTSSRSLPAGTVWEKVAPDRPEELTFVVGAPLMATALSAGVASTKATRAMRVATAVKKRHADEAGAGEPTSNLL